MVTDDEVPVGYGKRGRPPVSARKDDLRGVLSRLKSFRSSRFKAGQKVVEYILAHPQDVMHASVTEVAEAAQVSEATVVRLCQRVGYNGFQDLRVSLARDMVEPTKLIHEDVRPGDSVSTVVEKVLRSDIEALTETLKVLDMAAVQRAADLILSAKRVEFYGVGFAGLVAIDASYRLLSIGINAVAHADSHMQAVSASLSGPDVVAVAVSHSGSSKEIVDALRLAKQAGAHTVCITNRAKSPITAYADVALYTAAAETMFRAEAMASRIAELSIIDALYVYAALSRLPDSLESIRRTARALAVKRF